MNMNKCTSKQFFFNLHRLVGSCAPVLHRRGRRQAARRKEKSDHPPKARTFPPLLAGNPPDWGLPLNRLIHDLPPSQIAVDPGLGHHETALWKASKNENPPRRGASPSAVAAASTAVVDADAAGERWSPKLQQEPNRGGP
jgi:hypothetical protein